MKEHLAKIMTAIAHVVKWNYLTVLDYCRVVSTLPSGDEQGMVRLEHTMFTSHDGLHR